ncbi:MAG: Binding-protein-dependent transport systems inner membrane component [Thermococcales archaeon 44_46]|nr:MAG: Binding-protein-dependent transport systems inner membrane component [Thermococcales archaeon 44_46]
MKLKIELPKRKDELLKSFALTLLALFVVGILLFLLKASPFRAGMQ